MRPAPLPLGVRLLIAVAAIGVTLLLLNPPRPAAPKLKLACAHIGPQADATVVTYANGDMAFLSGVASHQWPDVTVGCPERNGRVDMSAPGCDTLAELLASVNRDGSNWRCWIRP